MSALILHPDGSYVVEAMPQADALLGYLQNAVGGYIERVRIHHLSVDMILNEEGLIHDLPVNPTATRIWEAEHWVGLGQIRGTVVFLASLELEDAGLTPEQLTTIKERYLHE